MFNWFKKKENPIKVTVEGINPQTENEFLFFHFVETETLLFLEKWYEGAKLQGMQFKPQYEDAIKQKIKTGEFKNPHSFPEYFDSQFDFIAIDFETANNHRISACALGLVFIKNGKVVFDASFKIKPPEGERFARRNIEIHGITAKDVTYAMNFTELWESELSKYFNNNLILFHNSSMDLSILRNLFELYSIKDYKVQYLDTMKLAEKSGNPKKLSELADLFEIEFENIHDPKEDAAVCAFVFEELIKIYPNYKELYGELSFESAKEEFKKKEDDLKINNENLDIIQLYSLPKEEVNKIDIEGQGFVFTGDITIQRGVAKKLITDNGGLIKSGVTSKVNYVVVGTDFGWSKIQKVHSFNSNKNCQIKILTDSDFEILREKYEM